MQLVQGCTLLLDAFSSGNVSVGLGFAGFAVTNTV
jgi:hypothetical protein